MNQLSPTLNNCFTVKFQQEIAKKKKTSEVQEKLENLNFETRACSLTDPEQN